MGAALGVYGPIRRAVDIASAGWAGPHERRQPAGPTSTCRIAPKRKAEVLRSCWRSTLSSAGLPGWARRP